MNFKVWLYGLACFKKVAKSEYRVLFPDGRDALSWGIPVHVPCIAIDPGKAIIETNWAWQRTTGFLKFYIIDSPREVSFFGVDRGLLDDSDFNGRLPLLKAVTGEFELADFPDAVMSMTIDSGKLVAGQTNLGMAFTTWEVETNEIVTIQCGSEYIKVKAKRKADGSAENADVLIVIANVSLSGSNDDDHFHLYRKLAKDPNVDVYIDHESAKPLKRARGKDTLRASPLGNLIPMMPGGGCSAIRATVSSGFDEE